MRIVFALSHRNHIGIGITRKSSSCDKMIDYALCRGFESVAKFTSSRIGLTQLHINYYPRDWDVLLPKSNCLPICHWSWSFRELLSNSFNVKRWRISKGSSNSSCGGTHPLRGGTTSLAIVTSTDVA